MINFFGYYFKKLDFIIALIDIFICSTGFFLYAWFGLASSNSTTPELISPIFLSFITGLILWGLLFAVGINSVPKIGRIVSFFLRAIIVFFLSIPIIVPLWFISSFEYAVTPLLTIPAIFMQICILCLVRILIVFLLPKKSYTENVLLLTSKEEKVDAKLLISQFNQYHIKRYLNCDILNKTSFFNLNFFCKKHYISKLIISNILSTQHLKQLIDLSYSGVNIITFEDFKEQHLGKVNLDNYYNFNSFINKKFVPTPITALFKRLFDICIALFIFILSFPIFVVIGCCIKICDGGPIFYVQKRMGKDGVIFKILKFRSMAQDAEKNGIQWAKHNDNRVTSIGKLIRKTRIDELPQLLNILKNDMSLVGPRPERPEIIHNISGKIKHYNERHRIKPGLTGWAQINIGYGDSIECTKKKLEYDLYYLKHYNISLDLLIILKTISVILWPSKVH